MNDPKPLDAKGTATRRGDPVAIAFIVIVALMFLVGAALGVNALLANAPPPAGQPAQSLSLDKLTEQLQLAVTGILAKLQQVAPPQSTPKMPDAPAKPAPATALAALKADPERAFPGITPPTTPAAPHVLPVPTDATWNYDVFFGPAWTRAGQLRYQTLTQPQGQPGANMSWIPNGGQATTWFLGIVAPNHPSHANTRFPGFFMHTAYLPDQLVIGQRLRWEFPWQGGAPAQQSAHVRRYELTVTGWERVTLPAGEFDAARMDGTLRYVDGDSVKAEVRYSLWYAPRAKQVVRLLWMGRAPDESSAEMIAELAAYRGP